MRLQRSRKLSRSGYKLTEVYSELNSAVLAGDPERACCLTAELSCTAGGHGKSVASFLLDSYCARCVNSSRGQLSWLVTSLADIGLGTHKSPCATASVDPIFRRGVCTLALLVTCGVDPTRNVSARFARVPRSENVSTLDCAIRALRTTTGQRDAHSMSSVMRAVPDEAWFCASIDPETSMLDVPDLQRLRANVRREPVWGIWMLARELGKEAGVSEYVDNCLKAFAWGYSVQTVKSRIHLLWYAFLVIIKGAPRHGSYPLEGHVNTFERALLTVDTLFDDIITKHDRCVLPPAPTPLQSSIAAPVPPNPEMSLSGMTAATYLYTVTQYDPTMAWAVEKDRENAQAKWEASFEQDKRSIDICSHRRRP